MYFPVMAIRINIFWTVIRNFVLLQPEKLPKVSALQKTQAYFFVKNSQKYKIYKNLLEDYLTSPFIIKS